MTKFKKGDIAGGAANLVGTTLQAPQSLYLNAINAIDSIATGKGLPKFQYNMDKATYDKMVANRRGETETLTDKATKINPLLGATYGLVNEMASDPLELTPVGMLNDIKMARGLGEGTAAYTKALQSGKMTPNAKAISKSTNSAQNITSDTQVPPKQINSQNMTNPSQTGANKGIAEAPNAAPLFAI